MTQLGMGVAALNQESAFQAAYERGIKKSEYWTYTLEDCINLLARLPALAARIYRNVYKPGQEIPAINKDLDLIGECAVTPLIDHRVSRLMLMRGPRQLFQHAWVRQERVSD